jgi:hypothetical protein
LLGARSLLGLASIAVLDDRPDGVSPLTERGAIVISQQASRSDSEILTVESDLASAVLKLPTEAQRW